MSKRTKYLLIPLVLACVLLSMRPTAARVLLKPKGQNAVPLRAKSLQANVTITGQFATTRSEMVFQNEAYNRIEADFIYTVPPHTVVTYFAYWFGKEKVVARVVEKERAAAIYQQITARQRDPALIELIGQNTFRARIFPIEPNADLRVEMRMVQVLPSDRQGAYFTFPLQPAKAGTGTLERLTVKVYIKPSAKMQGVSNNFKLPVTREKNGDLRLQLIRRNFRPVGDWRIGLRRRPQALHIAAYSARSGGPDGFFALALTPNQAVRRPVVKISGVPTYDVVPTRLPNARARQVLTIFGRYKGSGMATVTLTGLTSRGRQTVSQKVLLSAQRENNNLATKLWAARRIEQLSVGNKNRGTVVALSTRFTLPSRFTSWLAVPRVEMAAFQQEKAEVDLQFYGHQIALLIRHGRGATEEARDLRRRFANAAREAGRDPQRELKYRLGNVMLELQSHIDTEKAKGKKQNRARIARLQRDIRLLERSGALHHEIVRRRIYAVEEELLAAQRELEQLEAAAQDPARKQQLKQRVDRLGQRYDELLNTPAPPSQGGGGGGGFRSGDPLISIEAPEDAARVIALLPGGEIKPLSFNADSKKWEARFDIPTYAAEGEYSITVIITLKDGTRRQIALRYRVDLTPPKGSGRAQVVAAEATHEPKLRLELETGADTARVFALLPWHEKVELMPSTLHAHRFFALVLVPSTHRGQALAVTYVLTDKAHNRTTVMVDVSR